MEMDNSNEPMPVRISLAGKFVACGSEQGKNTDRSTEEEADQESGTGSGSSTCGSTASAEDVESPKSVVAAASDSVGERWRDTGDFFHIQVLRLKEEESHLGEDIWQGFNTKYSKLSFASVTGEPIIHHRKLRSANDVVFTSKSAILPASPLGENGVHN